MSAILAHALAFARHGFAVRAAVAADAQQNGRLHLRLPQGRRLCLEPGKHPYGPTAPNGLLSATTETGIIKHWFTSRAPEANLGVVIPAGVLVLDFDPRHGGELVEFEAEHGDLAAMLAGADRHRSAGTAISACRTASSCAARNTIRRSRTTAPLSPASTS